MKKLRMKYKELKQQVEFQYNPWNNEYKAWGCFGGGIILKPRQAVAFANFILKHEAEEKEEDE